MRIATLALLASVIAAPAAATDFSNNLAASYDQSWLSNIFTRANACGCGPLDSAALVDAFSVPTTVTVTTVKAALTAIQQNPVSTFTGFGNAAGYQVNIYSSLAAAAANLNGDVYSKTFAPGAVGFAATVPVPNDGFSIAASLATFAVDAHLTAGSYYASVIGIDNPDDDESIGVATGGTGTAALVNPGGDFGIPGNTLLTGQAAGYAISGTVPEPATWALLIGGFGFVGGALRQRRAGFAAA